MSEEKTIDQDESKDKGVKVFVDQLIQCHKFEIGSGFVSIDECRKCPFYGGEVLAYEVPALKGTEEGGVVAVTCNMPQLKQASLHYRTDSSVKEAE